MYQNYQHKIVDIIVAIVKLSIQNRVKSLSKRAVAITFSPAEENLPEFEPWLLYQFYKSAFNVT